MKFTVQILILFILLIVASAANAFVSTPSIDGKVHNYSKVDNGDLILLFHFSCTDHRFGGLRINCGAEAHGIDIHRDGSFHIPAVWTSTWSSDQKEMSVEVAIMRRSQLVDYDYDTKFERNGITFFSIMTIANSAGIDRVEEAMKRDLTELSVYEIGSQSIQFKTASGQDYGDWIKQQGRDLMLELTLLDTKSSEVRWIWRSLTLENPGMVYDIKPALFALGGKRGAKPSIRIRAEGMTGPKNLRYLFVDESVKWSGDLPLRLTSLTVDDERSPAAIDGTWAFDLFMSSLSGVGYFGLDLKCAQGKVVSKVLPDRVMSMPHYGTTTSPAYDQVSVQGTCGLGSIDLQVKFLNDPSHNGITKCTLRLRSGEVTSSEIRGESFCEEDPVRVQSFSALKEFE